MVGVTAAILAGWLLERRVHPMPLVTLVFVLVLGGLTLWLKDDRFIKLKPTLFYSIAAAFLLGGIALGRAPLGWLLGSAMQLDEAGWRKLTLRFGLFFVAMAVANEVIWRNFSEDLWVKVKVFGFTAATFVFLLFQGALFRDHALEEPE
jgi:intracellular septation protein